MSEVSGTNREEIEFTGKRIRYNSSLSFTYVVPSSLIAIDDNPDLLSAALALDAKAKALVASAVSSEASD
jgi:hypothetical protein